eukprot:5291061-Amphidinium_carterae.2
MTTTHVLAIRRNGGRLSQSGDSEDCIGSDGNVIYSNIFQLDQQQIQMHKDSLILIALGMGPYFTSIRPNLRPEKHSQITRKGVFSAST